MKMGKIGVLDQNVQIRLKNGQKWTKMVKNGEIRLKMAISVAGVPPRSETVSHTSPTHRGVLSGREVAFLKALRGVLTLF